MASSDEGDDVVEDELDSVELLSTGRVRFTIDGTKYSMRLPKHGEYKRLRLMLDTKDGDPMPVVDQEAQMEEWAREAFKMLADKPLPDAQDDWPQWVVSGVLAGRLLVHWRDVPLAPGVPLAK